MITTAARSSWRFGLLTGSACGVLFAVATAVALVLLVDSTWRVTVLGALIGGASFGVPMGFALAKHRRGLFAGAPAADPLEVRRAHRLLRHPRQDADPATLHLALHLARHQLEQLEGARPRSALLFAVLTLAYTAAALVSSPWWWLAAALFAGFWLLTLQQVRVVRRRIQQLEDLGSPRHR